MRGLGEPLRWWPHLGEGWRRALEWSDWALAAVWCARTRTLMNRLDEVPDLTATRWDLCPVRAPGLVVVVPARDEAATLAPGLETLLAQDYPWLRILVVDDRSSDGTGDILDEMAERRPERLGVVHLTEEAAGWIAKTFALEAGARGSRSEWLLFTEAGVWFSPSVLRRALAFAEMGGVDHLVVAPSTVSHNWGESVLLGSLNVARLWVSRPWRVADPGATWDAAGAESFHLIRREAWEELDGFAPQRLAVKAGAILGRRVRAAGMSQRLVFAPGLVLRSPQPAHLPDGLTKASTGLRGLTRAMTKTMWAAVSFRLWMAAALMFLVTVVFLGPPVGLAWWRTAVPSLIVMACLAVQYRAMAEVTGVDARWGWLYPLGVMALLWAIARSVAVTLWQGGVRWRGAVYSLRELRRHNSPFAWEFGAARARAQQRRVARGARGRGRYLPGWRGK